MTDRPNQLPPPGDGAVTPRRPAPGPGPREDREGYYYGGYGYDYYDEPAGGGLLEYWQILKRHRGSLVLITFLGAVLAVLVTMPQTPIYQATASIEIQRMNPQFLGLDQVSPVQEAGYIDNSDLQTQVKIIQSESLLARVLDKLGWTPPPEPAKPDTSRLSVWQRALKLGGPEVEREPRLAAIDYAADNLKVRLQTNTRIVEISVDSPDPKIAAQFANTMADEFIEQNLEARWKMTQRTSEWLSRQLEEMRVKLEAADERVRNYARRAGLVYTRDQEASIAEQKLEQLQNSLTQAQDDRIKKESRYHLLQSSPPEALPDILDDDSLRGYQTTLTDLRRQLAELSMTYTADHPRVQRLRAQIQTVENALESERAAILQRIRNDYQEALAREKLLRAEYERQQALVSDQASKAVQYNILKREADSIRELYEAMLEKVKSASVASALRASNVRVVDPARIPEEPYKPRLALNTFLGLLLGGFFAVVFVIARERMDRTIQEPGDAAFYLNLPELGTIPAAEARRGLRLVYRSRRSPKGLLPERGESSDGEAEPVPVELTVWKRKPTLIAESFRAALTSILFSGQNGDQPRVVTLTSPGPQEGKTTVASNLAIALAEINRRVLLIDADLRKPRQHEIFHVSRDHGLAEILLERGPLSEESLNGSIRATGLENLYVLPAGEQTTGSTNLLYSKRMAELLERLDEAFDMILIDTPPMMQIPDARILGRLSDAVILVIRAGHTTRDTALAARERLTADGTRVLGTILNYWDPKKSSGGYYHYYDRYYRTRYYHEEG